MKQRREGRVQGDAYVIVDFDGTVIMQTPLAQAAADEKLAAAIARNGWEAIPK